MIRIVGIQRSHFPQDEFVLLQNQGAIRLALRGHLLMTEEAIGRLSEKAAVHSFSDEAYIPAGAYVILKSGYGDPRWARTKDGASSTMRSLDARRGCGPKPPAPCTSLTRNTAMSSG